MPEVCVHLPGASESAGDREQSVVGRRAASGRPVASHRLCTAASCETDCLESVPFAGAFGTAGDKEADDFCIRQLLPNKLKDQYCFKTEAAIKCLKFVKGEKIWLK